MRIALGLAAALTETAAALFGNQTIDEERGLRFEADLGDGPTARDVADMVARGDVRGASFRFRIAPDGEQWDGERRTLTRVEHLAGTFRRDRRRACSDRRLR